MQTAGDNLADPATVEVRLMGRFAVLRDGREIDGSKFGGRKVRTLLRVLASRQGQFVSNDVLAEALWSDRQPADPAANLQVLVNRARRAVGRADVIRTCAGGYALAGPASCTVDAEWFLAEVDQAGRSDGPAALAVYRKALAAVAEPLSEDSYADWARAYRERIHLACQVAWERAAALAVEHGEAELGVSYARAAAGAEPLREAAAIVLIRALAAAGDRAAALAELDDYRRRLADELGLDPSPAIDTLHRQLLRPDPGAPPAGGIRRVRRAAFRRPGRCGPAGRGRAVPWRRTHCRTVGNREVTPAGRDRRDAPRDQGGRPLGRARRTLVTGPQPAADHPGRRGPGPGGPAGPASLGVGPPSP